MGKRVLVAYTSRYGATTGVAEKIGQTLAEDGLQVDVLRMEDVHDLSAYDAVVAGSAIQGQKWLPEAMRFIQTNRQALSSKPFASFLVCITLGMKNADNYRQGVTEWMAPVRNLVRPVSEGVFAGQLLPKKLPFSVNGISLRAMVLFGVFPKGDHRDWQAITAWAKGLHSKLV